MHAFIALFAIFAVAQAGYAPGIISTGTSSQIRSQDGLGNYNFAYNEQHATGGSSRSESGNAHGGVVGSYTLNVADGRQRVVKYVADALGFRAAIATNEPGTKAQAAAATSISAPGIIAAAPVAVAAAAPVLAAPAYGAAYGPALAGPIYGAPAIAKVAVAPAISAYSSVINHAAPVATKVLAAPVLAAPILAAPAIAKVAVAPAISAYSSVVNHAGYAAPIAGKVLAAPGYGIGPGLAGIAHSYGPQW